MGPYAEASGRDWERTRTSGAYVGETKTERRNCEETLCFRRCETARSVDLAVQRSLSPHAVVISLSATRSQPLTPPGSPVPCHPCQLPRLRMSSEFTDSDNMERAPAEARSVIPGWITLWATSDTAQKNPGQYPKPDTQPTLKPPVHPVRSTITLIRSRWLTRTTTRIVESWRASQCFHDDKRGHRCYPGSQSVRWLSPCCCQPIVRCFSFQIESFTLKFIIMARILRTSRVI